MAVFRAFIPIELPEDMQDRLDQVISHLKENLPEVHVRWVPAKNIHLTLKFLGDVSDANYEILTKILMAEAATHRSFEFSIGGLGAYPNNRRPRVIWVGVQAPNEMLMLQRGIDAETARLGYASEKREFSPHLTLGRVSRNASARDIRSISQLLDKSEVGFLGVARVDEICLYRSELKPGGAVYTRLFTAQLGDRV
jgi:2'-5' RNA ligase